MRAVLQRLSRRLVRTHGTPSPRFLGGVGVGVGVVACTFCGADALAEGLTSSELSSGMYKEVRQRTSGISIKELGVGDGALATAGSWVSLHYSVRLLGDGTLVEDTRSSGYGDRDYGEPVEFMLGDLGDAKVLRALHAAALDMRVGGRRRVRTSLSEPHFGYRDTPTVYQVRANGLKVLRRLHQDWLVDVEVELVAVQHERPAASIPGALQGMKSTIISLIMGPTSQ
jgi:hypothetical protein